MSLRGQRDGEITFHSSKVHRATGTGRVERRGGRYRVVCVCVCVCAFDSRARARAPILFPLRSFSERRTRAKQERGSRRVVNYCGNNTDFTDPPPDDI